MKVYMEHNRTLIHGSGFPLSVGVTAPSFQSRSWLPSEPWSKSSRNREEKILFLGGMISNLFLVFGGRALLPQAFPIATGMHLSRFCNSTWAFEYKRHHILLNRVMSAHAQHDAIKSRDMGPGIPDPCIVGQRLQF